MFFQEPIEVQPNSLLGISFDGVIYSGITVEFLKLAQFFKDRQYRIYFDPGFDIKVDKGHFFQFVDDKNDQLPDWVSLTRVPNMETITGYTTEAVDDWLKRIHCNDITVISNPGRLTVEDHLVGRILKHFIHLNVRYLVIENGTLPENITYSRALFRAIHKYGRLKKIGKYVIWRDHDLMWWSEPEKYGFEPYPCALKPHTSPHIQYWVLHELAAKIMRQWAPGVDIHCVPNTFIFQNSIVVNTQFRCSFNIPENAFLIARTTRIIRQKRLDREIYLLNQFKKILPNKSITLFIAGNPDESPCYYSELKHYAYSLGVSGQIIWGGNLEPAEAIPSDATRFTVHDLYHSAQCVSFLTSWCYEGFGNPPGEAIANNRPFWVTSYEVYQEIYENIGIKATLMSTTKAHDGLPDECFVNQCIRMIMNPDIGILQAEHNQKIGRTYFSRAYLNEKLHYFTQSDYSSDQKDSSFSHHLVAAERMPAL